MLFGAPYEVKRERRAVADIAARAVRPRGVAGIRADGQRRR